ncbi:acyltransferase family protein [Ligilactobacillus aviarius]|uniref:Acyltransferase 3 domain-containing protein n=1 Tax=Candidatus Gallilactobacillus intestinavium TaxID=2840838 RepID=A0A9D9H872_9LACO|nr:acyltransferase family protein [Ligilactobacillus aviarius]MBO8441706.1 hypothetical protein [Candidatus Gallilactobacillus intestinavium]
MKKRNVIIDEFRIVAVVLVIMIHSFLVPQLSNSNFYYDGGSLIANTIGRYAVPIFMLITSYYYFLNPTSQHKKKIIKNFLRLWFVWIIIYIPRISLLKGDTFIEFIKAMVFTLFGKSIFYAGSWYLTASIFGIIVVDFLRQKGLWKFSNILSLIILFLCCANSTYFQWLNKFDLGFSQGNLSTSIIVGILWVTLGWDIVYLQSKLSQVGNLKYVIFAILLTMVEHEIVCLFSKNATYPRLADIYFTLPISVTIIFIYMIDHARMIEKNKVMFLRDLSTLMYFVQWGVLSFVESHCPVKYFFPLNLLITFGISILILKLSRKVTVLKLLY